MSSIGVQRYHFPKDFNSRDQFIQNFKKGDIVFYRATGLNIDLVDFGIISLQKIASVFTRIVDKRKSYSHTVHVYSGGFSLRRFLKTA